MTQYNIKQLKSTVGNAGELSDIIYMALSDEISFSDIYFQYGLKEKDVKSLMRNNLKRGSYKAWRKRVRRLGSQREYYK
tara:strand:+ start:291 stop:527 length:237 start_codon:yes stop_codon:yes gene_type:complete